MSSAMAYVHFAQLRGHWALYLSRIPCGIIRIRRNQFDLVYGNNTSSCCRNALVAAKLARVPFIYHVRGLQGNRSWPSCAAMNLANSVIVISRACADSLRARVFPSKLRVVHNGVDLEHYASVPEIQQARLRREMGLRDGELLLVMVAHLRPLKGQEYALRAVAECNRSGVGINLLLVGHHNGDRPYVEQIRALVHQLGLSERIKLLGFREDIREILSIADVCLHTSLSEGHGRAVIEAMASGLPVVAFSVGGVPESVVDGQTGYLVAKGDTPGLVKSILKLAADPSVRSRMGHQGRQRAKECFSAETTARRVGEIIEETLAAAKG